MSHLGASDPTVSTCTCTQRVDTPLLLRCTQVDTCLPPSRTRAHAPLLQCRTGPHLLRSRPVRPRPRRETALPPPTTAAPESPCTACAAGRAVPILPSASPRSAPHTQPRASQSATPRHAPPLPRLAQQHTLAQPYTKMLYLRLWPCRSQNSTICGGDARATARECRSAAAEATAPARAARNGAASASAHRSLRVQATHHVLRGMH
jgi:hypothetical protein